MHDGANEESVAACRLVSQEANARVGCADGDRRLPRAPCSVRRAWSPDRLDELAGRVKTEQFPAGTVVLQQSGEPSRFLYLVRHGSVEILDDGRPRRPDRRGRGVRGMVAPRRVQPDRDGTRSRGRDLLPHRARGREGGPRDIASGMTFVISSLRRGLVDRLARPGRGRGPTDYRPVGSLVRRPAVTCEAGTTVADAAELMAREHVSSLLVPARRRAGDPHRSRPSDEGRRRAPEPRDARRRGHDLPRERRRRTMRWPARCSCSCSTGASITRRSSTRAGRRSAS